ncbi:MAG: hypothetical protein MJE77_32655 [Proteobacteria bacterium]|nr:hypothetical protein [Pseudomonadota bacterium]
MNRLVFAAAHSDPAPWFITPRESKRVQLKYGPIGPDLERRHRVDRGRYIAL